MHRRTVAHMLLSLFTTDLRAAEIEGDLIEERVSRGDAWFTVHVIGTTIALFGESYKQAPLRITAASAAAAGLSVVACDASSRMFFSPHAFVPVPFLGCFVIFASAFLIGCALEYLNPGLGVRAATLTTFLLMLFGLITLVRASLEPVVADAQVEVGAVMLSVLLSVALALGALALSIVVFLAPLMIGSVYACKRSDN